MLLASSPYRAARRSPRHSTEKRIGNVGCSHSAPAVALSQVRRTDGRQPPTLEANAAMKKLSETLSAIEKHEIAPQKRRKKPRGPKKFAGCSET
jgi:hypothetical protein